MEAVYPYVRSEQIFTCPSAGELVYHPYDTSHYGSYAISTAYWGGGDSYTPPVGVSLAQLAVPATTAWVADGNGIPEFQWQNLAESYTLSVIPGEPRSFQNIVERHLDTVNVLHCDGHVKALKLDSLVEKKTMANGDQVMTRFTI
jgi:prepilin-type processing-associated H-X9-DG protein